VECAQRSDTERQWTTADFQSGFTQGCKWQLVEMGGCECWCEQVRKSSSEINLLNFNLKNNSSAALDLTNQPNSFFCLYLCVIITDCLSHVFNSSMFICVQWMYLVFYLRSMHFCLCMFSKLFISLNLRAKQVYINTITLRSTPAFKRSL